MFYKPKKKKSKGPDLKAKLDKVFSEYIRLRDSKKFGYKAFRCISCGKIKPYEDADCGHYINRQHMSTRFDEMNCNAQCRSCNRFDEGNMSGYRRSLVERWGEQRVTLLELKRNEIKQYSDFEYTVLIEHYKKLVKEMKNEKG